MVERDKSRDVHVGGVALRIGARISRDGTAVHYGSITASVVDFGVT
jgi:hypothetical protein